MTSDLYARLQAPTSLQEGHIGNQHQALKIWQTCRLLDKFLTTTPPRSSASPQHSMPEQEPDTFKLEQSASTQHAFGVVIGKKFGPMTLA